MAAMNIPVKQHSEISWNTVCVGWIFPKWIRLFRICKLLSDKLWCKEYRKTNSTGTVQHLYTSIPVGGTAGRFDFLYWNLRRRGAGNAYRNLCRQWSDDPLWTSGAVYVHQFPILAEPFLWIWTMVRKKGGCISRPERRTDEKS